MNSLTRIMSYDKTKFNQENCNCEEYTNVEVENQIIEHLPLTEEEIEQIIKEKYFNKDEKTKIFIRKALRKHGDRYDYSNVVYVKSSKKVEIICRVKGHKPFPIKPNDHLQLHGCKSCAVEKRANKRRKTKDEFIREARKVHGDKYDYSKVKYKNANTNIIIICPIHGDFPQTPNQHLNYGCKKCGFIKTGLSRRSNKEIFIKKARKLHGDKYDYSKVNYVNERTEIIIICPIHSDFPQTPHNHLGGQGCPKCNDNFKGEITIENYLMKNNIKFEAQKRFKDCKDKRPLPFDFYIPYYNLCIEFDGEGHFQTIKRSKRMTKEQTEENLKLVQKHDKIKTDYCKNNGINLLRIKYDENVEEKIKIKLDKYDNLI